MSGLRVFFACGFLAVATMAAANPHLQAVEALPPGEQYRQLSLMLLVSAGVDEALGAALTAAAPPDASGTRVLGPDDYATPLVRIVDQRSLLQSTAGLFALARDHRDLVRARLDALEAEHPLLMARADQRTINEDAVIIRGAIADAVEGSGLVDGVALTAPLARYREYTLYLRNTVEFQDFERELAQLTGEAIASVGGQLDAYQRMFDDQTGADGFDGHIEAAESIYTRRGMFDPDAGRLTEDMIRNWVLQESKPSP